VFHGCNLWFLTPKSIDAMSTTAQECDLPLPAGARNDEQCYAARNKSIGCGSPFYLNMIID
jgi:hypothetical protein